MDREVVVKPHDRVKNFEPDDARDGLEEIIAQRGARDLHMMTAKGDLHVRVTKKGRVLVSRSRDGGRSWSRPLAVSRVRGQAIQASVAAAGDGTLGITWYDDRRDPGGPRPPGSSTSGSPSRATEGAAGGACTSPGLST
jgi:hypothetical protein